MIHERLNILPLLFADIEAKRSIYETADTGRDAWPCRSKAWFAASTTASQAWRDLNEAEHMIREQLRRDGLDAATLRALADILEG